ncbi:MAG: leucyl aminopeptidase [Leptospiraceae bacterium]|nr:leucyl aminopeptidase [Leptospiraceae bacterium]MCP5500534.1 leucyl aminopeptidase [Leptospiraceae bacterium]
MKLEKLKFTYSIGKSNSEKVYKIFHVFKEGIKELEKSYRDEVTHSIFNAEAGQQFLDHKKKTLYIGLGSKEGFTIRKLAKIYIKLGNQLSKWTKPVIEINADKELSKLVSNVDFLYHLCTSLEIGATEIDSLSKAYKDRKASGAKIFFNLKSKKPETLEEALEKAKVASIYTNTTRYIQHLPANHFSPEEFVAISKEIAKENKLKITVFDEDRLKKENFNGILSVCQGSDKKAKMIILEYNPAGTKSKEKIALVGKGLTFDAGGISLKPSGEMHEMKYDMSGAATVINAIGAIASLGLKVPVIAAIGVAENMPDASAIKPGDVYTAYNGVTVEVQNTDAEGRLVLGDVLAYVCEKYKPDYLLDFATLTGAVIIALGHEAAGVMCNDEILMDKLEKASAKSEDRIWRLPLWEEYGEDLKSDIADVRNITGGRAAGTISAARFLAKFVSKDVKWAHVDIAGTAWRSKASGTQCSGPTGYGIRLLLELVSEFEKK